MFCVQRQMQTSREGKVAAISFVISGTFLQAGITWCLQQEKEVNLLSRTWCIFEVQVLLSKNKGVHFQVWSPVVVDQLYRQVRWLCLWRQEDGRKQSGSWKTCMLRLAALDKLCRQIQVESTRLVKETLGLWAANPGAQDWTLCEIWELQCIYILRSTLVFLKLKQ